jgi:hypothetical protein
LINDELGGLFEDDPSTPTPVSLRQGVVEAWDPDTGENSIQIAGGTLVNLPALTSESASLVANDVVALLSAGDRWMVLGKVTTPGDPGTVPSWVGDISALAPLTDLAAVTDGLVITGATNESDEPGTGPRVVINDPTYPGEIVLYTDSPEEIEPARIKPVVSGTSYLRMISPKTSVSDAPATLDLYGTVLGSSGSQLDADQQHFFATDMKIDGFTSLKLGDGSDYISIAGQAVTDADLSSLTNTFPTFPYYYGYLSASQSIPHNTATKVTGWVADGSPNSSGITHSAGNFTIPTTGRYRLRAQGWWALIAAPAGARTLQWIRISPNTGLISDTTPASAAAATPNYAEKTVLLSAGEQVFVQVVQAQGVAVNLVGSNPDITYVQIEWVGP